jgi:large subunit ribosomal protein L21
MKYAVVESGGKQYIAREGETIEVDRLPLDIGKSITFDKVLLVVDGKDVTVGAPSVQGAKVKGTIIDQIKAKKVIVFKYIPRERYRRKQGHRQRYTQVAIDNIAVATARKKAAEEKEAPKEEDAAAVKKAETSAKKAAEKSKPKKAETKAKPKKAEAKAKPKKAKAKAEPKKAETKAKPKKAESKGKTAASKTKTKDAKAESKTKRTSSKTKKADKK